MTRLTALTDAIDHWFETAPYRAARFAGFNLWSYHEKDAMHALGAKADGARLHLPSGAWQRIKWVGKTVEGCDRWELECCSPPPLRLGPNPILAPLMVATDSGDIVAGANDNTFTGGGAGGGGGDWTAVRNYPTGTVGHSTVTYDYVIVGHMLQGGTYYLFIWRASILFDARALPSGCTLTAGHIHLRVAGAAPTAVHYVTYSGAEPGVAASYAIANWGSASRGSIDVSTTGAKVLTITDLSGISTTAVSPVGLRDNKDLYNIFPGQEQWQIIILSSNTVTPANRPILHLSYTTGPSGVTITAAAKVAVYAQPTAVASAKVAVYKQSTASAALKVAIQGWPSRTTTAALKVAIAGAVRAALKVAVRDRLSTEALLKVAVRTEATVTTSLKIAVTNLAWQDETVPCSGDWVDEAVSCASGWVPGTSPPVLWTDKVVPAPPVWVPGTSPPVLWRRK